MFVLVSFVLWAFWGAGGGVRRGGGGLVTAHGDQGKEGLTLAILKRLLDFAWRSEHDALDTSRFRRATLFCCCPWICIKKFLLVRVCVLYWRGWGGVGVGLASLWLEFDLDNVTHDNYLD